MSEHEDKIHELEQKIAKLESQMAFIFKHQEIIYPEELNPKILDLLRQGKKIEAITLYRQETNVGLKQAKAFVENLEV